MELSPSDIVASLIGTPEGERARSAVEARSGEAIDDWAAETAQSVEYIPAWVPPRLQFHAMLVSESDRSERSALLRCIKAGIEECARLKALLVSARVEIVKTNLELQCRTSQAPGYLGRGGSLT